MVVGSIPAVPTIFSLLDYEDNVGQQVEIDQKAVKSLAKLLREADLSEIEYQIDSLRIKVKREPVSVVASSSVLTPVASDVATGGEIAKNTQPMKTDLTKQPGVIEAQMVGTVYLAPGPGADPFVKVGDKVTEGQTLFIIEAMKVMNMIKSPRSGIVSHIFVKDGQPVEYGDPIIIVD